MIGKYMRNKKFRILILGFVILIGCNKKTKPEKSNFKLIDNYNDFTNKMENNDTLTIGVNLSVCMWREYDQVEITKTNDSIYLQLKEKYVMDDKPAHFPKVLYKLKNDTLNLEKIMSGFDINYREKINNPFFIISNPKEKDTILLRTTGLGNHILNIKNYQRIMLELYPKEMEKYKMPEILPPKPTAINRTNKEH